jgi:carbon-monoxide dehydrogenase small subunit
VTQEVGARPAEKRTVRFTVNGKRYETTVEPRMTLVDMLRIELGLVGTHVGCEHGVCGACTILVNGQAARSCIMLGVQADGAELMTIEGLHHDGELHPIQQAFIDGHGVQCGFCTPGFIMTVYELLSNNPVPSDEDIYDALGGNICRCTGYESIIRSVKIAAEKIRGRSES